MFKKISNQLSIFNLFQKYIKNLDKFSKNYKPYFKATFKNFKLPKYINI